MAAIRGREYPRRPPSPGRAIRERPIEPQDAILYAALLVAAIGDAWTKRIPNWLTLSLMIVALAVQASPYGEGVLFALKGLGAAFALHFVLWSIKLEGAGDAKLMMGVGAVIGWETMIEATLWRYVLLLPYAIVTITVLGRWRNFARALAWTTQKVGGQIDPGERPEATHMPFGPLIAIAVPLAMHTDWLDFIR